MLEYLAELVVNGPSHPGAVGPEPATLVPSAPRSPAGSPPAGWRDVLVKDGPEGWARAVRAHKGTLITDTTMCEASNLAKAPHVQSACCLLIPILTRCIKRLITNSLKCGPWSRLLSYA